MNQEENEVTFKGLFFPLTTKKAIVFIFIIGFIVYFNSLFNGFVWDDISFIQYNPEVHTVNFEKSFTKNMFNSAGYYRPIPALYFATTYLTFHDQPFFYHLMQISLHVIVTILLYLMLIRFFNNGLSLFLSLIFLVHPINVESVGYIASSQSELYSLFGLIALLLIQSAKTVKKYLFTAGFLLLALLTKEVGILFIFLTLLWQALYRKDRIKLFVFLDVFVVLLYSIIRFSIGGIGLEKAAEFPIARLSLLGRIINIPAIIFYYLKTFFFPKDLAILQQWTVTKLTISNFYLPFLIDFLFVSLLLGIFFYIFRYRKSLCKPFIFFTFWFFSGLFFSLQIFPLDQTVADRWFYLPLIGLLGIIGVILKAFWVNNKKYNIWVFCFASIILLLLSTRTIIRNFDWLDNLTITSHDIKISKDSWALENELSYIDSNKGRFEDAKTHAQRSIMLDPNTFNYINLGLADVGLGDYKQANLAYLKALRYGDYYLAYENLAVLSLHYGNPRENMYFIKNISLKKYPQNAKLWLYLALLEYNQGNVEMAKTEIKNAYSLDKGQLIQSAYYTIINNLPLDLKINKLPQ